MIKNEIQWFYPSFGKEEKKSLNKLIESNYLNEGKQTIKFEKKLAKFLRVKYAIATTSGTAALTLSLLSLGVGVGDEVIVPNFTFIASANAARFCGATIKLVDVCKENFLIDVDKIEDLINEKTKAIVSVDVNGRACNYYKLKKICKKKKIHLVCDSAEALGSKHNSRFLGTFGDLGCFSFSAAKTISTGQGGLIVTNEKKLYNKILELKDQGRRYRGTGGNDKHPSLGFNFKFTDLQATVGLEQFSKLKKRLNFFKKRDAKYYSLLKEIKHIEIPPKSKGEVLQWFDILVKFKKKPLLDHLHKNKIGFREFWFPLSIQNPYKTRKFNLENSFLISKRGLWLPSNFDLNEKQIEYISKTIKKFYES